MNHLVLMGNNMMQIKVMFLFVTKGGISPFSTIAFNPCGWWISKQWIELASPAVA
jgi:hypothetical protein